MADMNLGARINNRLAELGQKPMWLCEQVNLLSSKKSLSIGNLSALINRDSKKSEYASVIAAALGVNLDWLLTGDGEKLSDAPPVERANRPEPGPKWPFEKISPQEWDAYPTMIKHYAEVFIMQAAIDLTKREEERAQIYASAAAHARKSSNGK